MSIPFVQAFHEKHAKDGLVVIGVNVDDDPSQVPDFVKYFKMTYSVVLGGGTPVSESYGVQGIPSFVMIDKQGQVVRRYEGFAQSVPQEWESDLQQINNASQPQ